MRPLTESIKKYLPALAFFAGFLWDALTIGRRVHASDLLILTAYLIAAIPIIMWLVKKSGQLANNAVATTSANHPLALDAHWKARLPYLLLQFLFGSLFCALFILYFKSSSHFTALLWSLGLGVLLVANEFLETHYKRFTLIWTLFGFCLILLLNFVIPYVLGSVHWIWFYVSVILAVLATRSLKLRISPHWGRIGPTYLVAIVIASAYVLDVIPPVPLVKRDIEVGSKLVKVDDNYVLQQDKAPPWIFWRSTLNSVHINQGDKVYCISSVFAPAGLEAKLYHRWQFYDDKKGWLTMSRIGFALAGGRNNGFRGYTFKQNLAYGQWRVKVETEHARTIAVHQFVLKSNDENQQKILKKI